MNFKVLIKKPMERDPKQTEQQTPETDAADRKALAGNGQMDAQKIEAAHQQAEQDMEADAELTASSPNDDLDEGETARLGEDIPDIIG
ncbi:hypothetical protein BUE76_11125 [Cnuella takakiae]|nr:hypothetical protein BUE76_11125 [Cnuella takakiae]